MLFPESNFYENIPVRIINLCIKNFKNVANGQVNLGIGENLLKNKPDIRGVYGQNGTGKTSIIKAIKLIKGLMVGGSLPKDINEYVMRGKEQLEIIVSFFIGLDHKDYLVDYSIVISKVSFAPDIEGEFFWGIKNESITFRESGKKSTKISRIKTLIKKSYNVKEISPKYRNDELKKFFDTEFEYEYIQRANIEKRESFIFGNNLIDIISKKSDDNSELRLIPILRNFALFNLHVLDSNSMALSSANILLPLNFNIKKNHQFYHGVIPISISKPEPIPSEILGIVDNVLSEMNKVLYEIIPGLRIHIKKFPPVLNEQGKEMIAIELLACKGTSEIPIRYESDGIKKIISVLNLIVNMYNDSSMVILIDELDAGIFEYLLGEILLILEESGKGQLIFTSHNLRPLEVLNRNSLIFTTTNPKNRYIKLKNIKPNNNMRDVYYRDIVLNGQDEIIYEKTDSAMIKRALRKSGGTAYEK